MSPVVMSSVESSSIVDDARAGSPVPELSRPRIKICGITNPLDANAAGEAGADYLGFVFIERSTRHVTPKELTAWWSEVPSGLQRVALFQNAAATDVGAVINQLDIDVLQFHGQESAEFCEQFGLPYWKAIGLPVVGSAVGERFTQTVGDFDTAQALLLDAVTKDRFGQPISGGSGKQFDWALWPHWARHKLVLAGGLDSGSVGAAVTALSPWAVDVSTGVEASAGRKDHDELARFCSAVTSQQRAKEQKSSEHG